MKKKKKKPEPKIHQETSEKQPIEPIECLISKEPSTKVLRAGNYFFRPGWREGLCRCRKCLNMYQLINVNYLIQDEEKKPPSTETPPAVKKPVEEDPLNTLSRQREIAYGIMEFRDNLMEFLKLFAVQKMNCHSSGY